MKVPLSSNGAIALARARAAEEARRRAAAERARFLERLTADGLPPTVLEKVSALVQTAPTDEVAALGMQGLDKVLAITPQPSPAQIAAVQEAFRDVRDAGPETAARLAARVPELQARALTAGMATRGPAAGGVGMAVLQRVAADPRVRFAEAARDAALGQVRHLTQALSSPDDLRNVEAPLCERIERTLDASRTPWVLLTAGLTLTTGAGLALASPFPPPVRAGLMIAAVAVGLGAGFATHARLNRNLTSEVAAQARAELEPRLGWWETRAGELTALRDEMRDRVTGEVMSAPAEGPAPAVQVDGSGVVIGKVRVGRRA